MALASFELRAEGASISETALWAGILARRDALAACADEAKARIAKLAMASFFMKVPL
jgi:hypothetical protein